MIRIKTDKFSGKNFEEWQKRAREARQKLLDGWKPGEPPKKLHTQIWKDFKKEFLLGIHSKKCAYCEAKISANANLHVEHYRPKRKVTVRSENCDHSTRKPINHPGYFWLAYEWHNLILACPHCNTYHTTEEQKEGIIHPGETEEQKKKITHPGKLNEFRINGTRINKPSDNPNKWIEELKEEKPLLLHPYFDNPEDHITFDDKGVPYPKNGSERGQETIQVCNLNRETLNEARRTAKQCNLYRAINDIYDGREINDVADEPFSAWLKHCIASHIRNLQKAYGLDDV